MAYKTLERLYKFYVETKQDKRAEEMKAKMELKAPKSEEPKPKKESKK